MPLLCCRWRNGLKVIPSQIECGSRAFRTSRSGCPIRDARRPVVLLLATPPMRLVGPGGHHERGNCSVLGGVPLCRKFRVHFDEAGPLPPRLTIFGKFIGDSNWSNPNLGAIEEFPENRITPPAEAGTQSRPVPAPDRIRAGRSLSTAISTPNFTGVLLHRAAPSRPLRWRLRQIGTHGCGPGKQSESRARSEVGNPSKLLHRARPIPRL